MMMMNLMRKSSSNLVVYIWNNGSLIMFKYVLVWFSEQCLISQLPTFVSEKLHSLRL